MMQRDVIAIRRIGGASGKYYSIVKDELPRQAHLMKIRPGTRVVLSKMSEVPNAVRKVGTTIRELTEANPDVKQLYEHLEAEIRDGAITDRTICFDLDDEVDSIAWETLYVAKNFVSLREAPIFRQIEVTGGTSVHDFLVPLKFLVILSATPSADGATVSAVSEWASLYSVLKKARSDLRFAWGLNQTQEVFQVVVMTNDRDVACNIAAQRDEWVECGNLRDETSLRALKDRLDPHFIHVFCHGGRAPSGQTRLILGDQAAYYTGPGKIELTPAFFEARTSRTWLVTLNACWSAHDEPQGEIDHEIRNFAKMLVKFLVPAALGMRERIDVQQAAVVIERFYTTLFDQLKAFRTDGAGGPINFGKIIADVRYHSCCNNLPHGQCVHWSIPVLYVRDSGLNVVRQGVRTAAASALIDHLDVLKRQFAQVERELASFIGRDTVRKMLETTRKKYREDIVKVQAELTKERRSSRVRRYLTDEDRKFVDFDKIANPTIKANTLYDGATVLGRLDTAKFLARAPRISAPSAELGADDVDRDDWTLPEVGWGVVLPLGAPPPPAIARLVEARRGKVFRYDPASSDSNLWYLLDEATGATPRVVNAPMGMEAWYLPRFLLIYGGPATIPWSLQYQLNMNHAVGRLDLEGDALDRYVDHAINEWTEAPELHPNPLIWATLHSDADFTRDSYDVIAEPLARALNVFGTSRFIGAADATHQNLIAALDAHRPNLIVTASHGKTEPLDALAPALGLPIDQALTTLSVDALLEAWRPDGAIWYAHACCSAGADANSAFEQLFDAESPLATVMHGVAGLGSIVAPLPTRLLSADKPLRAFIGHVEPTFNWTLRDPETQFVLSEPFVEVFERRVLGRRTPIGSAMKGRFDAIGPYLAQHDQLRLTSRANVRQKVADILVARDIQRTVILGDPAVAL